jgi:putative transposase
MYIWRAVDDEGEVLDVLVQAKRDRRAALKPMRKLLRKQGLAPEDWVNDKLPSYGGAARSRHGEPPSTRRPDQQPSGELTFQCGSESGGCFKTPASAQRFLCAHSAIYNTFNIQRHLISRRVLRILRGQASVAWQSVACAA